MIRSIRSKDFFHFRKFCMVLSEHTKRGRRKKEELLQNYFSFDR